MREIIRQTRKELGIFKPRNQFRPATPEDIASLESEEQLYMRLARKELIWFAKLMDPAYHVDTFHEALARLLEKVLSRKIKRLIVTVPPQHGKSRLASVEFPAWALGKIPTQRVTLASYSSELSTLHTGNCQERMKQELYRALFPKSALVGKNPAKSSFQTCKGGGYRGVGVGGSLTGHAVDILIIDDPFKNHEEAHSEVIRESVWNWFLSTAYTRLQNNGVVVIIMTRWHKDDLVGRILDPTRQEEMREAGMSREEQWKILNLPAIAEEGDLMRRPAGESLAPSRFSKERLKSIKAVLGPYLWDSLYKGDPRAAGGNHFDRKTVRLIKESEVPTGSLRWCRFWDLAAKENEHNDRTASVAMGMNDQREIYVKLPVAGRWAWPKARSMIKEIASSERYICGIEGQGGFTTAVANLMEVMPKDVFVREVTVHKDKLMRALGWLAVAANGKMNVVIGPRTEEYLAELEEFPHGAHDDWFDATSGAFNMLASALPNAVSFDSGRGGLLKETVRALQG